MVTKPAGRRRAGAVPTWVVAVAGLGLLSLLAGCASPHRSAAQDSRPPSTSIGVAGMPLPPPVDVVIGRELSTADGRRLSLAWARGEVSVYRVPAGWLVADQIDGGERLWLVTDDGDRHALLPRVDGWAIAADGRRLTWRDGDQIVVGRLEGRRIVAGFRTRGIGDFRPHGLLKDAVLLAWPGGDGPRVCDLWFPARGPFIPTPRTDLYVLGSTWDGHGLIGWVPGEADPCLVRIDPATLAPQQTACGSGVIPDPGAMSPDGRWLLLSLYAGSDNPPAKSITGNPTALVDLSSVFADPVVVATWPDEPGRSVSLTRCVWPDNRTVYCPGGAGLARLSLDRPGAIDWVHINGTPVPRFGV